MKVLIVSHVPVSTYEAMGITFCSLFKSFKKEELCQLYFYPSVPDIDICNSYYQITDYDLLHSLFLINVKGREVKANLNLHKLYANEKDAERFTKTNNHQPAKMILRDFLWSKSKVITPNLNNWILREKPTCIFVAPGGYSFTYDIASSLSKIFKLPIVSYVCDEYYFVKKQKGILWNYHQKKLSDSMEHFFEKTNHIVGICDEITDIYHEYFKCEATTICTGSRIKRNLEIADSPLESPSIISYFGNIVGYKRYKSLIDVGKCLEEINAECDTRYLLNVYSGDTDEKIINELTSIKTIKFKGYVSGQTFEELFSSADLLLHVEAFDSDTKEQVKNSVSTKIADSLASGNCLVAYGPEGIASINHLKRNNCAFVATNYKELKAALELAFSNDALRSKVKQTALDVANEYHNSEKNSKELWKIFAQYGGKGK